MRYTISRGGTRIRDRAVTLTDYADLAMQVPGVSKSVALGTVYTAVRVRVAPPDGQANVDYMAKLCNSVEAYLSDKIMIGSTVQAEPLDPDELWQDVYIQVLVHVQGAYNRTTVRLQVDSVVRALLAFNTVDFGYLVSIGAIYRAVLAVQGVAYAELTWLNTLAPVDDTDPENGDTFLSFAASWRQVAFVSTATTPSAQHYWRDSPTNPTMFGLSETSDDPSTPSFSNIHLGDHVVYRPELDPGSWMSFVVTAAPTHITTATPGWWNIPVAKLDQATTIVAPANNDRVGFEVIRYTPTPDSVDPVQDINTDELLIPRIAPVPLIFKAAVNTVALTSNVVTLTTALPHGMVVGATVDVAGVTPSVLNGRYVITAITSTTTLTYSLTHADVASTAQAIPGSVTTVNLPESEIDYPDLSEAERTHDGLWIKAVGGLPNT
jgi:hypothetical protein